ncbi:Zinc/iron permease [Punctularia strigosozonata HHB-11173 SS5]|uniref:Zinc/iron permease n=1 Tax=Punctularia strigosozonata (strain HHB-11173) TaxID=741275 RepID=R7S2Q2_PUNST|nr:Zinc/iron permease [Punctularia strigosozonata HHB-11173 SS5]EIN04493.1 Zinc/iron permease [Punctularia strigosozonata HHB-11173 SS5]
MTPATLEWSDGSDRTADLRRRLGAMGIIFSISLFAVSFPTLSKKVSFLRIPKVVFFIGKHFGTGVILSTAFVHMLQDAFEVLLDPETKKVSDIGDWVGIIVLASLISIFLVEYISTSYVDQMNADDPDPEYGHDHLDHAHAHSRSHSHSHPHSRNRSKDADRVDGTVPSERAPLLPLTTQSSHNANTLPQYDGRSARRQLSYSHYHPADSAPALPPAAPGPEPYAYHVLEGHHRHESREEHALHHGRMPRTRTQNSSVVTAYTGPGAFTVDLGAVPEADAHSHSHAHTHARPSLDSALAGTIRTAKGAKDRRPVSYGPEEFGQGHIVGVGHVHRHGEGVGHHAHGLEETEEEEDEQDRPLDELDCDHAREHEHEHEHAHEGDDHPISPAQAAAIRKRQVVSILVLQLGIMMHSSIIGVTLSITSGPEFASLLIAVAFHQLFEGLSLGIRIASLPSPARASFEKAGRDRLGRLLKPTLAVLFAITVPVGVGSGLLAFGSGTMGSGMRLWQGIMSAVSAGMLIYAACVEMLAGDFVMDPLLWRSGLGRQALALASLLLGAGMMAVLGRYD